MLRIKINFKLLGMLFDKVFVLFVGMYLLDGVNINNI